MHCESVSENWFYNWWYAFSISNFCVISTDRHLRLKGIPLYWYMYQIIIIIYYIWVLCMYYCNFQILCGCIWLNHTYSLWICIFLVMNSWILFILGIFFNWTTLELPFQITKLCHHSSFYCYHVFIRTFHLSFFVAWMLFTRFTYGKFDPCMFSHKPVMMV